MATYFQALLWAAAIILVALGSRAQVMPKDLAEFLVLTLPLAAWIAIGRGSRGSCKLKEA